VLFYTLPYLAVFLPFSLILFFSSKYLKIDNKIILIFLSLFFYSWWNIYYLPVILISIIFNYFISKKIISEIKKKKFFLFLGIFLNILLLGIFKYFDFIIENINFIFSLNINLLNLPFPLAISFFTFQSITFLINSYDEEIINLKAKDFFLFIVFFPQLVAGPIVKYNHMMPQFKNENNWVFNKRNFSIGLIVLFIGFVKKVYFADTLSTFVDTNYENLDKIDTYLAWLVSLCFTFQFYFDFSGYVDMATGSAIMMNIYLPQNFNSPYKSTSIINFWQRWHITLTHFLTNYIYSPILRSFKNINFFNSMVSILAVFLIAGLWHGPSWTFVIFGAFHGVGLIINHSFKNYVNYKIPNLVSWFITFNFVNISFVFFRSETMADALLIIKKMFNLNLLGSYDLNFSINGLFFLFLNNFNLIICFLLSIVICFYFKNTYELLRDKDNKYLTKEK
tara:strand:- start:5819 stop:7168 length:1350 start_codon:yes stop_codon:yes gene_type:complete